MKAWSFAIAGETCGRCGATIGQGEVYLAIAPDGLAKKLKRCETCAEQAYGLTPPDSLEPPPPPVQRAPDPVHPENLRRAAAASTNWRLRNAVRQSAKPKFRPSRGPRPQSAVETFDPKMAAAGRDE